METAAHTPGLAEALQTTYTPGPSTLPALRNVGFRPQDASITAGLTALLTRPEDRDAQASTCSPGSR